jgi:hypothetical protein
LVFNKKQYFCDYKPQKYSAQKVEKTEFLCYNDYITPKGGTEK